MKKGNSVSSRNTAGLFLVVVGCLGLLFLGSNGVFADTQFITGYVSSFEDDVDGPVGDDWITAGTAANNYLILSGGKLMRNFSNANWTQALLRPVSENFRDGKIEMIADFTDPDRGDNDFVAFFVRLNPSGITDTYDYYTIIFDANYIFGFRFSGQVLPQSRGNPDNYEYMVPSWQSFGTTLSGRVVKIELSAKNQGASVVFDAKIIDLDGDVVIFNTSYTDDNINALTGAGQWGIANFTFGADRDVPILSVRTYELVQTYSLVPNITNIKLGNTITYTLTASKTTTVTLSDDKGGSFMNGTTVELNEGNNYTATVSYTPLVSGTATVTADFSTDSKTLTSEVVARPYSTVIGFIGDSITAGAGSSWGDSDGVGQTIINLGKGFSAINRGAGGSNTQSRIDNTCSQGPDIPNCMIAATGAFLDAGVDIINIMLGTNETEPANDYKANMQTIIDTLHNEGFKHIILNQIPYKPGYLSQLPLIQEYNAVLVELVDENAGFVLLGDTLAFTEMETISGLDVGFMDGVHPNNTGYAMLGKLRADAIRSALEYQINPNASFLSGNIYTLGTTESLTFRVDKYFGEFNDIVKVDGVQLATSDYVATSGSTTIELNADYLNTLAAGDHTLTVGFEGGVQVAESFTILPDPTLPPVNPPTVPTVPATPSYAGGGDGGTSLVKDSCPNGDLSPSYYDKTCGTTANLTEEVARKVNLLRPIIKLIYLTATEEQKTFVHNLITSCSEANKNEVIKLACQELVEDWEF